MRIVAYVFPIIQWKHLQITFALCQNFRNMLFFFAKNCHGNASCDRASCVGPVLQAWSQFADRLEDFARPEKIEEALSCLNLLVTDALRHVPDVIAYLSRLRNQSVFNFCAIPQVNPHLSPLCTFIASTFRPVFASLFIYLAEHVSLTCHFIVSFVLLILDPLIIHNNTLITMWLLLHFFCFLSKSL